MGNNEIINIDESRVYGKGLSFWKNKVKETHGNDVSFTKPDPKSYTDTSHRAHDKDGNILGTSDGKYRHDVIDYKVYGESFDEGQFIEDILALDEISKKTLGSYVKRAGDHRIQLSKNISDINSASREMSHIDTLGNKKMSDALGDTRRELDKKADRLGVKDFNRKFGIHIALKKLTKEQQDKVNLALDLLEQMELEMGQENQKVISESTKAVVDAIIAGESSKLSELVDAAMQERIAVAIDDKRQEMSQNMFSDEELTLEDYSLEELEEFMVSEEFEELDEVSGKLLGSYIQKARAQDASKRAHGKELDDHPKVKALSAKISDYYNRREYDKIGRSKHRNKIDTAHSKIHDIKKKVDPNYPKSVQPKRYDGVKKAIDKLHYGKLTNESDESAE